MPEKEDSQQTRQNSAADNDKGKENDKAGKENNKAKNIKEGEVNTLGGQECPVCHENTCTLTEMDRYIPFGGRDVLIYAFSMSCSSCKYHKADVEFAEQKDPCRCTLEVSGEDDMNIRIIRSGEGTIKIPHITTIEGGPNANGYITNVEGLLKRVKHALDTAKENAESDDDKKKARKLLKKVNRIMWGQDKCKIIIEDRTGNSDILSEKAVRSKLKS
ncbi:MAG: ZPR1 zinc finger domain-containing protein [Candidatus Woesearchaeota archaeon]